jgi:CHAT domain-containing protein/tetratricopeptide (TPR) repeat protein
MQSSAAQKLARRMVRADDLDAFVAANRRKLGPDTVAELKDEVDRLVKVDLTKAGPLAVATRRVGELLGDPVSIAYGEASLAQANLYTGRLADAEPLFRSAIERLRGARRLVDAASVERQLVSLLYRQGRAREALEVAKHSRGVLRKAGKLDLLAQLETNVGNIYYYTLGRYRAALPYYDRAKALFEKTGDDASLAVVEYNRANVLQELDRPQEAVELYSRAEKLNLQEGRTLFAAQCSFMLAFTLATMGRYSEALRRFYGARDRLRDVGDPTLAAWSALYLADLNARLNVFDEATTLADTAFTEFSGLDSLEVEAARAQMIKARLLERQGDFAGAEVESSAAQEILDRFGVPVLSADARLLRAQVALAAGQDEAASLLARDALGIFKQARLAGRRAYALFVDAQAKMRQKDLPGALRTARSVRRIAQQVGDPWLESRAESLIGSIELDRGRHDDGLASLERAVAGIERLRLRLRPGETRAAFLVDKLEPYERLVAAHLSRGGADGLRAAFRYVEMAKSRALADLMAQQIRASGEQPGEKSRERRVRDELARRLEELSWYNSRIESHHEKGDTRNSRLDAHFRAELARCETELASLYRRLEAEDFEIATLLAAEPVEVDDIASELAENEAAVEFFTVGTEISAFVVTPDGASVFENLADARAVESHLTGLRFQIEKFALGSSYAATHRGALRRCVDNHLEALYRALLLPIESAIAGRNLLVIPHGVLHYVPIHALKAPDGKYLIERTEVAYSPSATVHRLCVKRPSPNGTRGLLAIGVGDARTPHISSELAGIGQLFSESLLLEGDSASKAAFLESAPRHRFLHLATHGYFRQDNPLFSSVRLVDGPLNFYDLFDLSLDAELVTLSACNTGINKLAPGDELSGLMRGFLYAGAPSLLVSLWAVNDESTSDLMRSFYGHLHGGKTKRAALRLAELEALDKYGHPYYWAPFVLMGKP